MHPLRTSHLITIFENDMKSMRTEYESEFKQIEIEATELAQKCYILVEYKRHRHVKEKDSMRKLQRMKQYLMLERNS